MARPHLFTVAAIAVCAYAACDLIHEVLGHGVAAALSPSVRALSLSTVALQTLGESRWVAAAGTIANAVAAVIAFAVARRTRGFGAARFFWLLLGATNLLNATGYFIFSATLGIGDWAIVIRGWEPATLWRVVMGVIGVATYAGAIYAIAHEFSLAGVSSDAAAALLVPAYLAGALLLVAGAAMNPIGPALILTAGAGTGFGAMAGLLLVPRRIRSRSDGATLPKRLPWVAAGIVVAFVFVVIVGRGVKP